MMLNRVNFEPYDLFDFAKILTYFFDFTTFGWPKMVETSMQKTTIGQSNRIFPKRIERTPTESRSSLVTHPSRAWSGTFAAGNLD